MSNIRKEGGFQTMVLLPDGNSKRMYSVPKLLPNNMVEVTVYDKEKELGRYVCSVSRWCSSRIARNRAAFHALEELFYSLQDVSLGKKESAA